MGPRLFRVPENHLPAVFPVILANILPVFAIIGLGYFLRRRGLIDAAFLRTGDRLVYEAFFPILLFWKIGGTPTDGAVPWHLWGVVAGVLVLMWLLSLLAIGLRAVPEGQEATFSQAAYRFNTYVAIAVVFNAQGDRGVAVLGEMLGMAIPLANVLAVVTFIWYQRGSLDQAARVRMTLRALVRNPLIVACALGMVWVRLLPPWPLALDNALRLASSLTLPFALMSIGGSLGTAALRDRLGATLGAAGLKVILMPLAGWWGLRLAGITGPDFLTAMLFFAMPASTAMYVLARQMDGDPELSSSIIVLTTLVSFFTLSAVLVAFGGG